LARLTAAAEDDDRYMYLIQHGIIHRVEEEDKIIYAELPKIPGVLVVYRKPSERTANPERLNLDRRELSHLPLLEGEERLRLLNFQHNAISKIENLVSLPNLIFLDLYSNAIKEISHLHTVPTLRVLMLGKNQIDRIKNLQALTKLDVLDLHSNRISKIENIAHLQDLRVLNLANNQITVVERLEALVSLSELNLRRNLIDQVTGLSRLPKLQRVFLSNNKLERFESMACLARCEALTELALDSNPVAVSSEYTSWVLRNCTHLKQFDLLKVTLEVREQYCDNASTLPTEQVVVDDAADDQDEQSNKLKEVIKQEWRLELARLKDKGVSQTRRVKEQLTDCLVQSGHAEIEGEAMLFIYGNALEVLNRADFQSQVEQISFVYVRFEHIANHQTLSRLKRFVKLRRLSLSHNNLHSFMHLSKLECITSLTALNIENNDVINTVLYRSFIVYRFPNIVLINGAEVTAVDKTKAKAQFQNFDKILLTPSLFKGNYDADDREAQKIYRAAAKKHAEFVIVYTGKLSTFAREVEAKYSELDLRWADSVEALVRRTAEELDFPEGFSS
jgi:leucine-rich repeat-containing protein 49